MGDTVVNLTHEPCSHRIAVTVNKEYNISRDQLTKYFGKSNNGGNDMKSVIYPYEYRGRNVAVVEFEERKWVESLIERQAQIKIKGNVIVSLEITKFEEILGHGSIEINPVIYKNFKSCFTNDKWDDILEECDITIDEEKYCMTGDYYKISAAKKMLDDLAAKHFCEEQNNPQHNETDEAGNSSNITEIPLSTQNHSKDEFPPSECDFTQPQVNVNSLAVDNSGNQQQQELETEADDKMSVDRHTWGCIKLTDGESLQALMEDYGIEWVGEKDYETTLRFMKSDKIVEAQTRMKEFIETAESGHTRKTCPIANTDENMINHAIETVRKRFGNVYINEMSRGADGTFAFVFISSINDDCEEAVGIFWQTLSAVPSEGNCESEIKNRGKPENSHELACYPFHNENLQLRVLQGNIVDQKVKAIVNAANADLHDGGGVTGAIFDAGGRQFRRRCQDLMKERNYQPLDPGEVVMTEACGKLNCESVLHAVAPKYHECANEQDCQQRMDFLCLQIFMAADQQKFHTISMPAMGTGIYGVPIHVFCKAMMASVGELRDAIAKGNAKYLREIRLVNFNKYQAEDIAQFMSSLFVESDC